MQGMIDALLAFSRSGRKAIRKTAVDAAKAVHQVFEEVKPQDRNSFHTSSSAERCGRSGDAAGLAQFVNKCDQILGSSG